MKYGIQEKMYRVSILLEILVGVSIIIAIAASLIGLVWDIQLGGLVRQPDSLQNYLKTAMTIVIGIEFVKMIFSHSIDAVVEVMLLAVARQMVIEHTSPLENLLAVASVALLFVVRKFLFVRQLDEAPSHPDSLLRSFLGKKEAEAHSADPSDAAADVRKPNS